LTSLLLRCLAALAALLLLPCHAAAGPVVSTRSGQLEGAEQGGVRAFLGIPFAAPPVGANRWRAPQPVEAWAGVRPATGFGPSCWQAVSPEGFGPWSREYVVQGEVSEDCLTLNVWAPAQARKPAPVLVWIHGGGFNSGSGAIPIYHGAALARRGIVVVTINYRVNVFGFLAHPELTKEAGGAPSANFGLQDMIAALRWVRENIRAFGGDPGAVTIAGQSAGASAVHALLASPMAKGLFHRAIAQSGIPGRRPAPALAQAEKDGLAFAAEKGAASLAELRALPAEALQPSRGGNAIRFVPAVDGALLPLSPEEALRRGAAADVPMLAGFTADELSLASDYGSADPELLRALLEDNYGAADGPAAAFYAAGTEAERRASIIELHRDRWRATLWLWAKDRAAHGRAPLYAYSFSRIAPGPQAERWRAFHSSEIPYVFGTLGAAPERGFTAADRAFSGRIASYWVNFVRTGDPNGRRLPRWPAFDADRPIAMDLGERIAPRLLLAPEKLRALAAHLGPPPPSD
jgi:para-nitrobenzyl esterase